MRAHINPLADHDHRKNFISKKKTNPKNHQLIQTMNSQGNLTNLMQLRTAKSKRISSYDRTGGNADFLQIGASESIDIASIKGAGIIKHIWVTVGHADPMHYRNLILRMYWDGETKPSVEAPLGDFFGQGWGEFYPYVALPLCAAPKRALNSYFPMPFGNNARIEIENDSEYECKAFYYYVDYEQHIELDDNIGRFHANWKRRLNVSVEDQENEWLTCGEPSNNLTDAHNHVFIDAIGHGHYVGLNYYVDCPSPLWYGEGDDMFFIDGESWPPSLHGTGTEDYFNSSYCPKEIYCHPYFGYARVNNETGFLGRTHCYRFHIEEPVIFQKSLRGSIEVAHANAMTLDLATVAYWYQTEPHKSFGPFPGRNARVNRPKISDVDIHRWREAWRQLQGGGKLWGNEALPKSFLKKLEHKRMAAEKSLNPPKNVKLAKKEQANQERMLNRRKKNK